MPPGLTTGDLTLRLFDLARTADPAEARAVAAAIREYRATTCLSPELRDVLAAIEEGCATSETKTDG